MKRRGRRQERVKGVEGDWVDTLLFTEAGSVEMEGSAGGKTCSV